MELNRPIRTRGDNGVVPIGSKSRLGGGCAIGMLISLAAVVGVSVLIFFLVRSATYPNPDDIEDALRKRPDTVGAFFDSLSPVGSDSEVDSARKYYAARGRPEVEKWIVRKSKYGFSVDHINWLGITRNAGAVCEVRHISGRFASEIFSSKPSHGYYLFVGEHGELLGWVRQQGSYP